MQIDKFDNEYAFLSNFYPCCVEYEGLIYPTSENAFQAAKTLNMKARKVFTLKEMTPGMSKHLGQALNLRSDWDKIRVATMEEILRIKFSNPDLKKKLIDTGDAKLIEGNSWGDSFWGVCTRTNTGLNFLGIILMKIRASL